MLITLLLSDKKFFFFFKGLELRVDSIRKLYSSCVEWMKSPNQWPGPNFRRM